MFREETLSHKEGELSSRSKGRLTAASNGIIEPRGELKPVWFFSGYLFLACMFLLALYWFRGVGRVGFFKT